MQTADVDAKILRAGLKIFTGRVERKIRNKQAELHKEEVMVASPLPGAADDQALERAASASAALGRTA